MSDERPTVRPVNLGRLVEIAHFCTSGKRPITDISSALGVSKRRARETVLESVRIGLIEPVKDAKDEIYTVTGVGRHFIDSVNQSNWGKVSSILKTGSPHYGEFLDLFEDNDTIKSSDLLERLEDRAKFTPYEYNETSLDVVGGWAQRLGVIQRNAFNGNFYATGGDEIPSNFPYVLLSIADDLEESAGINLQKRYISIPEIREYTCERLGCARDVFDDALVRLAQQNIGKLELSGAPIDTGAKDARYGIKTIELADGDGLISTDQSSEQVMRGVEQLGKQYYYLAVYDRDLQFNGNDN